MLLTYGSEHVIIPRTENTIKCKFDINTANCKANRMLDINSELDELDREEFFRLKKARLTEVPIEQSLILDRFKTRSKEILLHKMQRCLRRERLQRRQRAVIRRMPEAVLMFWEKEMIQMSSSDRRECALSLLMTFEYDISSGSM